MRDLVEAYAAAIDRNDAPPVLAVGRHVSLERIVEESHDGYYDALERSSAGWHANAHDARPWLDFFLGILTAAYRELE